MCYEVYNALTPRALLPSAAAYPSATNSCLLNLNSQFSRRLLPVFINLNTFAPLFEEVV